MLFGLCKFEWVNKCLSFFLVPFWSSSTPMYPQSAISQGTCPDFLPFQCFHFRLSFESIKEFRSASLLVHEQITSIHRLIRLTIAWTSGKPPSSSLYYFLWLVEGLHPNVIFPRTPKLGGPKIPKLGLPQLWRPITSCANLQLRWILQQSCSPCQNLCKYIWHATWTHVF